MLYYVEERAVTLKIWSEDCWKEFEYQRKRKKTEDTEDKRIQHQESRLETAIRDTRSKGGSGDKKAGVLEPPCAGEDGDQMTDRNMPEPKKEEIPTEARRFP